MKRVVRVSDSASRRAGGMFESIRGLCRTLAAGDRWRPAMVALHDGDFPQDAHAWEELPLSVVVGGPFERLVGSPILRTVEASAPDVVHLHGIWGPASRAALRLKTQSGSPPLVISTHGMLEPWVLEVSRWKKKAAWLAWNRALAERAAVLHALCEEEAESLARLAPRVPFG